MFLNMKKKNNVMAKVLLLCAAGLAVNLMATTKPFNGAYQLHIVGDPSIDRTLFSQVSFRTKDGTISEVLPAEEVANLCRKGDQSIVCEFRTLTWRFDFDAFPEYNIGFVMKFSINREDAPRIAKNVPMFCYREVNKKVIFRCTEAVPSNSTDHLDVFAYKLGSIAGPPLCKDDVLIDPEATSTILQASVRLKLDREFVNFAAFSSFADNLNFGCNQFLKLRGNQEVMEIYTVDGHQFRTEALVTTDGSKLSFTRKSKQ